MTPITAKAGDAIRIEKQLSPDTAQTAGPIDLTGKTVRVYVQFEESALVANQEVEYVDRAEGRVAVELSPSQTSNIGRHNIEWVIDPTGDPTTVPDDQYDVLQTTSPLDRDLTPSEEIPPDLTVTNLTANDTATVDTLDAGSVKTDDLTSRGKYEGVIDSRAEDIEYQNTTGSDMEVRVVVRESDGDIRASLEVDSGDANTKRVDNVQLGSIGFNGKYTMSATIPDGDYYEVSVIDGSIFSWYEQT